MSVQAMTWAFDQDLPARPKMVLMALANRADRATGRCFPGMELLAKEASVPERSVIRHIDALVRNGYVIKVKSRDPSGRQRNNTYFVCLDRVADQWGPWEWNRPAETEEEDIDAGSGEPVDIGEPSATMAPGETAETSDAEPVEKPDADCHDDRPPTAIRGTQQPSSEPRNSLPESRGKGSSGFSRSAQEAEAECIRNAAQSAGAKKFVIFETRAWRAWCEYRRAHGQVPSMPVTTTTLNGKVVRGWWMPTLFPPGADPPTGGMSDEDSEALAHL